MSIGITLSAKYRLERAIGSGGIGTVYRATDLRSGATVAVKVLHARLARDPDFVRRFRRGARIARKLRDPHIVQVLDHGSDGDRHYLVMEFVQGRPLSQLLHDRGRLPEQEARSIARQVALALAAAHQQGVVHRDISPGNILIAKDGTAKVSDFDVARAADATRMTQTGMFVGKVRYGAPESFAGQADIRSDIYSLGIVLYEMLTGHVPFDSDTPFAVVEMHRNAEPPGLEQLDRVGEGTLAAVVQRCLEKRAEGRFQDPRGLVLALEGRAAPARLLRGKELLAQRPSGMRRAARRSPTDWLRRPPARYLLIGASATSAMVLVLALSAVLSADGGSSEDNRVSSEATHGQSPTPNPRTDPEQPADASLDSTALTLPEVPTLGGGTSTVASEIIAQGVTEDVMNATFGAVSLPPRTTRSSWTGGLGSLGEVTDESQYSTEALPEELFESYTQDLPAGWHLFEVAEYGYHQYDVVWRRDNMTIEFYIYARQPDDRSTTMEVTRSATDGKIDEWKPVGKVPEEIDEAFSTIPIPPGATLDTRYWATITPVTYCRPDLIAGCCLDSTWYGTEESLKAVLDFYESNTPAGWTRQSFTASGDILGFRWEKENLEVHLAVTTRDDPLPFETPTKFSIERCVRS